MQPITLYSHPYGPNPWKVAIILEELSIPYETRFIDFADVKKAPFLRLNPNGRLPVIEDPNQDITVWESGAIVEYLLDVYDTKSTLSPVNKKDKYIAQSWLHFQMSGQGPYYGQASWFNRVPQEKIQVAIKRYGDEIRRVTGVLDSVLKDREWLVGDKMTYADLSFLAWQRYAKTYGSEPDTLDTEFPHAAAWIARMSARPAVKKVFDAQDEAIRLDKAGELEHYKQQ